MSIKGHNHPIFNKFSPWQGNCPNDCHPNYLGSVARDYFYDKTKPVTNDDLQLRHFFEAVPLPPTVTEEEYFEHIAFLTSVDQADDSFVMMELGAGFGRWIINAGLAMRRSRNLPVRLVGVEAEPSHFSMMQQHFIDNGFNPEMHVLVEAAVTPNDGSVLFTVGSAAEWWGQSIVPQEHSNKFGEYLGKTFPSATIVEVKSVSLNSLLARETVVDLIDMDIQGAEADVVEASIGSLDEKVKRVFIGTHGKELEIRLRKAFTQMGWFNVYDYPCFSDWPTVPGMQTTFVDGVQFWLNPKFVKEVPDGARVYSLNEYNAVGLGEYKIRLKNLLNSRWLRLGHKLGLIKSLPFEDL